MSLVLTAAQIVARNVIQKHLGIARAHATELVRGLALHALEQLRGIGESAVADGAKDAAERARTQVRSILDAHADVRAAAHKEEVKKLNARIAQLEGTAGTPPHVAEASTDVEIDEPEEAVSGEALSDPPQASADAA
ncbi:MAG: hypothetical protein AB7O62_00390 [Pirellulales bacterium]